MIGPNAFEALLAELETTADDFWNVSRENAAFLALLIKSIGAKRVLEVGTSNGYSTLWFARALVENGGGTVIAMEFDPGRAAKARANFERAGLADVITLVEGDAIAAIPRQTGPLDFVFLDADKPQYADYLRAALPLVRQNGLIVGDDTTSLRAEMGDYIDLVRTSSEIETVELATLDDGVIISRKR